MELAARLTGIGEYYFSKKLQEIEELRVQGKEIINLGIGNPDLPPHPDVLTTLCQYAQKKHTHGYQSYKGIPAFRLAVAQWYKKWYRVDLNADTEVLPLMGSKEGIIHLCMTYLNPGDQVLVPNPGYPTYRSAVALAGGVCVDYHLSEENDFHLDWKTLQKIEKGSIKMMFLNFPHMPTGTTASYQDLSRLVALAKEKNILLVHDNPYSFILNKKPLSILEIPGSREVAVELNSLSKSHNMAGWRIGMMVGASEHVQNVLRFKSNMDSGMFLALQMAAARALSLDASWYDTLNEMYAERRVLAQKLLKKLGCKVQKEQVGLFLWAKIPEEVQDGYAFSDQILYDHQIFITPGGIFGSEGTRYIRISLCSSLETLQKAMQKIKTKELCLHEKK